MKTLSLLSLLLTMACVLIPGFGHPASTATTGQEILNEIQKRYEGTNDFEANFVQEYIGKVMKRPQRGEGKVYFKKKGMMRWDYRVPDQKLISNGQTLWFYQAEDKQAFVSEVSKVIREKTPLAFLSGQGELAKDFELLSLNDVSSEKENNVVIELGPKEANSGLSKLTLTVDKKSFLVVQADVFDPLGNVTRTRFSDMKTNVGLQNSFFNFTIPPGTEILKFQEPAAGAAPGGKGPRK